MASESSPIISPAALNRLMRPKQVCLCRHVSEGEIRSAFRRGAHTFEMVQDETACSTACGTCEDTVRSIIADEAKKAAEGPDFT